MCISNLFARYSQWLAEEPLTLAATLFEAIGCKKKSGRQKHTHTQVQKPWQLEEGVQKGNSSKGIIRVITGQDWREFLSVNAAFRMDNRE